MLSDLDPMNVQDLEDGTSIDITTGQLYNNSTGLPIDAVDSPNVGATVNGNPNDTVAAPATSNPAGGAVANAVPNPTAVSPADGFIHSIESVFTNAYTDLASAGVIQTAQQKAAAQAAADARNAQLAQTQSTSTASIAGSTALLVVALVVAYVATRKKAA